MNVRIEESWRRCLQPEFDRPYFAALADFVRREYATATVYPPPRQIFHAFDNYPFDRVKAVIIGQDPSTSPDSITGYASRCSTACLFPRRWSTYFARSRAIWASPFPLQEGWSAGPNRACC